MRPRHFIIGIRAVATEAGILFQVGHRAGAALIVREQVVRIVGRAEDGGLICRAPFDALASGVEALEHLFG